MSDIQDLRARLRKRRDRDIQQAVKRLRQDNLIEEGELSDWVRDGFRKVLIEKGALETIDDIETAIERKSD